MTSEVTTVPAQTGDLAVSDVLAQVRLIQGVLKEVMVLGHHYDQMPGVHTKQGEKKRPPVLLKPGAEKLCLVFRLAPTFNVRTRELQNNHREYTVTCTLTHRPSGQVVATADGSCSTMETKYRYRNGKPKCPSCGAPTVFKSSKDPGFFCWKAKGGCGKTFKATDRMITGQEVGQAENQDIADQWNTVLKMAEKRALVAATLLATAASDMFVTEVDEAEEPVGEEPVAEEPETETENEPQRLQQQRSKPEPKRTPKESLIHDCLQMATALHKLNIGKAEQAQLMVDAGVTPPDRWADLSEGDLAKVKQAFADQLAVGVKEPKS